MRDADHDAAIPAEARLEHLIAGGDAEIFWIPEATTPRQVEARAALRDGLIAYERAFGRANLLRQLALSSACLRRIDDLVREQAAALATGGDADAEGYDAR
ncbi:MAG: hypothetical protein ACRCU1_05185 [Alsobacter sp.]